MNRSEYRHSECGNAVLAFCHTAAREFFHTGSREAAHPTNVHTSLGLIAETAPDGFGDILRDLSTYFYDHPEAATEAWEYMKDSVDPMGKTNGI